MEGERPVEGPALFELDENGKRTAVAGVPPDYFSADGQRWGSPTYRWDRIAQQNFRWWIDRFRMMPAVGDSPLFIGALKDLVLRAAEVPHEQSATA